ncbi:MAG: DUF86 domain-containing protein [Pseudomonas sp.]
MTKNKGTYLAAIHDCIRRIRDYTKDGRDAYFADTKTQDAVMRNIEIIGQAVKDFGVVELSTRATSIPWKQIAGMRDMLAHRYLGVDVEMTWEVVERDLDPVNVAIEGIAGELGVQLPVFDV